MRPVVAVQAHEPPATLQMLADWLCSGRAYELQVIGRTKSPANLNRGLVNPPMSETALVRKEQTLSQ